MGAGLPPGSPAEQRVIRWTTGRLGAVDVELTPDDMARIDALVPPCGVAVRYYDRANGLDLRPHLQRVM
jgi:hypothetical protein